MPERWTPEQVAAITRPGHVLLVADAGTGKTSTVVGRILWKLGLDVSHPERPAVPLCTDPCRIDEIAAVTFTERAALDLRRKLREELAASARPELRWEIDRASVGTIHGFCAQILRENALRLDIDPGFRVMEGAEAALRLREILRETVVTALEESDPDARTLLLRWPLESASPVSPSVVDLVGSFLRDYRWHADRYTGWTTRDGSEAAPPGPPRLNREALAARMAAGDADAAGVAGAEALDVAEATMRLAYRALARWLALLESENRRDFDSLVLDVRRLLRSEAHRSALEALRTRFRLLVVDEFQDTDTAQRDVAFALAGLEGPGDDTARRGPQLLLVGDPKQSIYRFRHADVGVWNEVRERMDGGGSVLPLTVNFRSAPSLVAVVNDACRPAFEEAEAAVLVESPRSAVGYSDLRPGRSPTPGAGLEWVPAPDEGRAHERRRGEAVRVASRIASMLEPGRRGPGDRAPVRGARNIAVVARTRKVLAEVERALHAYGIPTHNASPDGLTERQEVLDAINALRLADNPRDDLAAFAYLRSPFVGLRDEVLARIRLDPATGAGGLLRQAGRWLDAIDAGRAPPGADGASPTGEPPPVFPAPESGRIHEIEIEALRRGLAAAREAHELAGRADAVDVLEGVLRATRYRLHLALRPAGADAAAALDALLRFLDGLRGLALPQLLHAWEIWATERSADLGTMSAPEPGRDAVTLTTIHKAKGLEWPVVVLADAAAGAPRPRGGRGEGWTDPVLGPVVLPAADERDDRSERIDRRRRLEDDAEAARLLYVALTRARDRLIVSGPMSADSGWTRWLGPALLSGRLVDVQEEPPRGDTEEGRGRERTASAEDPATGTGGQLDAFGLDDPTEDDGGQLNLLSPGNAGPLPLLRVDAGAGGDGAGERRVLVWRRVEPIQIGFSGAPIALDWLDGLVRRKVPELVGTSVPARRILASATELQARASDPEGWRLVYVHGVLPEAGFAGDRGPVGGRAPGGRERGLLIHAVLEQLETGSAAEVSRLLDVRLGELDGEGAAVAARLEPEERGRLVEELERAVSDPEWAWLFDGPHLREVAFVHLAGRRDWRQGRMDFLRLPRDGARAPERDAAAWIVDYKTQAIAPGDAPRRARAYGTQVKVYREAAASILAPAEVRVLLHFTRPNVRIEA